MTDLASDALELAAAAVQALEIHDFVCATCREILDDRMSRVEQAMADAIDEVLAPDDELEAVA